MNFAPQSVGGPEAGAVPHRLRVLGKRYFPDVYVALAFALPLGCFICWFVFASPTQYDLRIMVQVDRPVTMQLFCDAGAGFVEENSVRVDIEPSKEPQEKRFAINADEIKALRFDPADGAVDMHVCSMIIRSKTKHWYKSRLIRVLEPKDLKVGQQIEEITPEAGGGVHIVTAQEGDDPYCTLTLAQPLWLGANWLCLGTWTVASPAGWLTLWVAGAGVIRRLRFRPAAIVIRSIERGGRFWRLLTPEQGVWVVAGVSVVLSCYPVVFFGKSFASPNFAEGTFQLYGRFPTLPGTADAEQASGQGADLGSMAWAHGPYAVVASRALWQDGELPLWNRFNYAGVPLLGQGQSMVGDPLHLLVLAAGGQAWAWDGKFVLAKWLFAAGVGLVVLAATGSAPVAWLLAGSAAFIGFFSYRLNHPAYFTLCYAPWIVLVWLRLVGAPTWRGAMRWAAALVLVNWCVLNSGTAKEAYMDLFCLNLCGCLLLLFSRRTGRAKLDWFLGLAGAGIVFCLLAAPILVAFFDTLKVSASNYDERHAWQLQPGMFIGLFDDMFYRQFNLAEQHQDPSLNFLVLLGTVFALSNLKRLVANPVFAAVAFSALLPAALVFGVVPPSLIRRFPILGNVVHIDNTFSCVLFIHLFVLAGFGLKECLLRASRRDWGRDALVAFLLVGTFICLYFGFAQAAQHTTASSFLQLDQEVARSTFFYAYVPTLVAAVVILPFVLRRLWLDGPRAATVTLLAGCLFLVHWRHGLQLPNSLARYTAVLPNRVDLLAHSEIVDFVHADSPDAFRVVGLNGNLMLGYSGVIGLENIVGPDALINPYYREMEDVGMKSVDNWFNREIDVPLLTQTKRFFDLLNVSYFFVSPGDNLAEVPDLKLALQADLDVYRNESAWPRAFFVNRLGTYHGVEEFSSQVLAGDGQPFATIDASELPGRQELTRFLKDQSGRKMVPAENYRLTNNQTSFDLAVPEAGVIVLTEAYIPNDFIARLNGQAARVFRINHAFKGIVVDRPGSYHVSFTYRPKYFNLALCASGLGLGLLIGASWWLFRRPAGPVDTSANLDHPASALPSLPKG